MVWNPVSFALERKVGAAELIIQIVAGSVNLGWAKGSVLQALGYLRPDGDEMDVHMPMPRRRYHPGPIGGSGPYQAGRVSAEHESERIGLFISWGAFYA